MGETDFRRMREAMVASQLRTNAVNDPRVVDAMRAVPRERHVPAELRPLAYTDLVLRAGPERALSSPLATGRLLTEARLRGDDRALVIAAGGGYAAAILARIVGEVVALEEDAALAEIARAAADGYTVAEGPLHAGWVAGAPWSLILIDGAVEEIPPAIVAQLADGGRLATAIVERGVTRLAIGRKAGDSFGLTSFADAEAPPLAAFARPPAFAF